MTQRKRGRPRCEGCGLTPELCACALFPKVKIETPIVIVQHLRERSKPTNTARLLTAMVPSARMVHFPFIDRSFDETPFDRPVAFSTLFPRDDATLVEPGLANAAGQRRGFAVLDGTWHQCSRMSRRVPRVRDFPCVMLPPDLPPSIWKVRTQHLDRGMSTFEAIVHLLAITEGPESVTPLQRTFEIVTARALFMKGILKSPDVPRDWTEALGSTQSVAPSGHDEA